MNISIRKFLLLNLLLAVSITTTITVIGNYFLDQRDIEKHLDTLLLETSMAFQALIGQELEVQDLVAAQIKLNKIPEQIAIQLKDNKSNETLEDYIEKFQFQIWSDDGKLLLHSAKSPLVPLSEGTPGFTDKYLNDNLWRVYTNYDSKNKISIVVAERYDIRNELAKRITIDDIYIMLWTYPLSGLLIWVIIGRGLSSLRKIAEAVSQRAPTYLQPVNFEKIPAEIKPLIEELNKLFLRLSYALEREKRFAGDAAHELRTPLAALKTQAQVALNAQNETDRIKMLKNVLFCVDRSTHVVEQLLTMSRLVPEATIMNDLIHMNILKLTAEIIAQLAPSALEKHIEIELISSDENIYILANITAISILIRNLVDNAIRYTPEGGHVEVHVVPHEKTVVLKVIDNGPGIPLELRSRVFERFFRVLGNKTTGSGLGLAIVQQIAKLHKATVKLGSPSTGMGLEVDVIFLRNPKEPISSSSLSSFPE